MENRSNRLRGGGEVLVAGMRQQVSVGGKSGPSLQASRGGGGGPPPPRELAWGAEEMGGRGRRRLTGPTERISARPGSCRQRHGERPRNRGRDGAGARRAQKSPLTSHLPARPSPGPGLLRGSLPGHAASARTPGRLRVPTRPTASAAAPCAGGACVVPASGGALPGEPRGRGGLAPFSAAVGRPFRSSVGFEALLALYWVYLLRLPRKRTLPS